MCMGGGGNRATITQPDYSAYNQQFELQKAAIDQQMSNSSLLMQNQLQSSLRKQNAVRSEIAEARVVKADNQKALQEEAKRLSVLMGPPPPEPTAQAPEVGTRDRDIQTRKGKSSMRIGRKTAKGSAKGTGLNIT